MREKGGKAAGGGSKFGSSIFLPKVVKLSVQVNKFHLQAWFHNVEIRFFQCQRYCSKIIYSRF